MSDPRAGLILAAEDLTSAAFNSANKNINAIENNARSASSRMGAAFSGLRSAAG